MHDEAGEPLTYRQRLWLAWFIVWALTAVLVATACSSCVPRHEPDGVPTTTDPTVARLVRVTDGEVSGYCTVFKIGDNLAMTAGHCCDTQESDEEVVELFEMLELELEVEKSVNTYHAKGPHAVPGSEFVVLHDDDEHDLCTLRGKLRGPPLTLAFHDPALGARVWTAGYPNGDFLISDGHWSGRVDGHDWAKASIAVWDGASGSPVMDADGRVVGILRGYKPPMSNMAFISTLEWMRHAAALAE